MAVLESTSEIFIPLLASLAKKCNGKDFYYTDKHGTADEDHAKQFVWALSYEIEYGGIPIMKIAVRRTLEFLKAIFVP